MIETIILSIIAWVVLCIFTFIFFTSDSEFWDKHALVINLPKSKKYETRNSPIYKIELSENDGVFVNIRKFSLKYEQRFSFSFFSMFFLYPIIFKVWRYSEDEYLFLCDSKEEIEMKLGGKTLRDYYENTMSIEMEKMRKENEKSEIIKKIMSNLNGEFNENYI